MITRQTRITRLLVPLLLLMAAHAPRATAISGFVSADTTWSGTVNVTGDIVINSTAHLTIAQGTRVYMRAGNSDFDFQDGLNNLCDIIVKGALTIDGGTVPGDSVFIESKTLSGPSQPGDWGYIFFVPPSFDTISSITGCTIRHGTRNLYLYLSAPPIAHCLFEDALFSGLYADSSNTGNITDCIFRDNGQYGVNMTGSSPVMLRCTFTANGGAPNTAFGGLNLENCRGRVAQCTFTSHIDGSNAIALDNSTTAIARNTFTSNAGVSVFVRNGSQGVPIDSCTFTGGKIGISTFGPANIRSSTFTNNAIGIEVVSNPVPTIGGGTLATACTFRNNPTAVRDTVLGVLAVPAPLNDWGATSEDSVWALVHGGVGASPWTDPTKTQVIKSAAYGLLTGSVTWSGAVTVRGDIYIAPGAHLTIDPGTVIRMQVPKSSWDTLSTNAFGTAGESDVIVAGTLTVNGGTAPGDSVTFTASDPLVGNDWGFVHFVQGSNGTVFGALSEFARVGFQTDNCSPSFSQCTARNNFDAGFRCQNGGAPLLSLCEAIDNTFLGVQVKDGTTAVVTGCRASGNPTGFDAENTAATFDNCTSEQNGNEGFVAINFTGSLRGSTLLNNAVYGIRTVNSPGATFGTQAQPNDITGSLYAVWNFSATILVQCPYTYWGTTTEATIVGKLRGPVNYSPWSDATHTTLFTSTKFGTLQGNTTWLGVTNVYGDIIVPTGVTLTISPGAQVKFQGGFTAFDDPRGTPGVCDIIVDGVLQCSGTPSTKITFTSTFAAAGDWGRLLLLGASNDSSRIEYTNVFGHNGVRLVNVAPTLTGDSLGAGFDTTLAIVGKTPNGSNVGIASPVFSNGVGLSLTGATGVLAAYRVSNGGVGVAINGGAPSLTNLWVNNARTGVRFDGSTSAVLTSSTVQSGQANGVGLHVNGASRPRIDDCIIKTTATDTVAAIGVKVSGVGGRPDLGGGRWGSPGGNAFVGFDGSPRFAVADSSAPSDTVWAMSNWWGTTNAAFVPARIIDKADNASLGRVLYTPILLTDPTPAALWSLTRAPLARATVRWSGEPRAIVTIWRADGARALADWPAGFAEIGRGMTNAQGSGEFTDSSARAAQTYTYALTTLGLEEAGPVAWVPLTWNAAVTPLSLRLTQVLGGDLSFRVTLPAGERATLRAFTVDGRLAATLLDGDLPAGESSVRWTRPASFPAGIYLFGLQTEHGDAWLRNLVLR